ncbi:ATP-binding cassette domain-containing protein [Ornithinimicrobium sp. Y1847]|uniref:ATP-binding cassette domain-containing protein n=1 Tax=unclassified Ornithinimicrobium TaxID=2615080 RepID=UPI003B684FD6
MTKNAVEVRDLRVSRGRREVLHGIDLDVPVGQIVGLLGPSGGGKSTLMRAVVGVQEKVTGTVRVLGETAGSTGLRRRVGYVTQSPSVYRDLTVRQNLRYFATLAGVRRGLRAEVDRALERVDLRREFENPCPALKTLSLRRSRGFYKQDRRSSGADSGGLARSDGAVS